MRKHPPSSSAGTVSRRDLLRGGVAAAGGLVLASSVPAFARGTEAADFVLVNGFIWTVKPSNPQASAVAIRDGGIVFVGNDRGAKEFVGKGTEVLDLKGRMVMPGIVDGHMHPLSGGRYLTNPSLDYAQLNLAQFLKRMAALVERTSDLEPDTWLTVGQWDALTMSSLPDRHDLDTLETARPILVRSLDGHIALANTRALDLAGITDDTPDPPDGEIDRDAQGHATGLLYDGAVGLVSSLVPPQTVAQNTASLKAAFASMAKLGITSYLDASAGADQLAALAAISDAGELTVRPNVALYVDATELPDMNTTLGRLDDLRATYGRPDVPVNTVKLFMDGLIEYPTQTAAMIDPYRENIGTPNHPHWVPGDSNGPTYLDPAELNPGVAALDAAGWQVHMHAIGDRAVRSGLDAIEFAQGQNGNLDNRHTLAHIEAIHNDEYTRFAALGAMANMQMQWAERDSYTMRKLKPYIGPARWSRLYAAGSLEAAGARVCGGSDWPVDPLLPFRQIEMAVNRTADEIYKGGDTPLNAAQAISLRSSIQMHTFNSAHQLHQAGITGAITRGRRADLVVLDRNLFDVKLTEVSTTKVLMTMVDGEIVHLKPELVG